MRSYPFIKRKATFGTLVKIITGKIFHTLEKREYVPIRIPKVVPYERRSLPTDPARYCRYPVLLHGLIPKQGIPPV
jgi:hypothetical protein